MKRECGAKRTCGDLWEKEETLENGKLKKRMLGSEWILKGDEWG